MRMLKLTGLLLLALVIGCNEEGGGTGTPDTGGTPGTSPAGTGDGGTAGGTEGSGAPGPGTEPSSP